MPNPDITNDETREPIHFQQPSACGDDPAVCIKESRILDPAVVSPIMGARTLAQAEDNLGALDVSLNEDQRSRLDAVSAPAPIFPGRFMARPMVRQLVFGGATLEPRSA